MKPIATDTADFPFLRKRGCIYVDKTMYMHRLIESVDAAFKQIREKGYAEPYRADNRPVWLIGLSFDSKTRELVDFGVEKF